MDLEKGAIDFRVPGRAETKKRRPNAPINARLLRLLRAAYKVREGKHVIMHRGGPLKSVKKAFAQACKRAGLKDVTPHTMKHTYVTWLLREGAAIWQVAGLTSTSPATISKVYAKHVTEDLRTAANLVSGRSARKVPEPKEKGF